MNFREPNFNYEPYAYKDVASIYPRFTHPLNLSAKIFKDIIEEKLGKEFTPFIKVDIVKKVDSDFPFCSFQYNIYVKFYYKGVHYQSCCTAITLNTDTVSCVCASLSNEIRRCMEDRSYFKNEFRKYFDTDSVKECDEEWKQITEH